ncbi:hypothetical protein VTN00DRAFT_7522 [Thermoascus crustaceus]|uniref:uncharacterized protein n=1 Tax=Thermoascus crustaceus TaxID=5088 RepID=UPI0037437F50
MQIQLSSLDCQPAKWQALFVTIERAAGNFSTDSVGPQQQLTSPPPGQHPMRVTLLCETEPPSTGISVVWLSMLVYRKAALGDFLT